MWTRVIYFFHLQYNRTNYSPLINFNMDGGTINIAFISESGIYNYA
ncbi:MAG: hypothetical protein ACPGVB_03965 [Chitinophagales bacterium]